MYLRFQSNYIWMAQTSVNTLKTQTYVENDCRNSALELILNLGLLLARPVFLNLLGFKSLLKTNFYVIVPVTIFGLSNVLLIMFFSTTK